MTFPFESLVGSERAWGLVLAVVLGFAFGFVLERAGFGRAPKLAAQFYLYDMTVFKVMFSGIVTAMLGLVVAAGVGLVDLQALVEGAASATFLWPMVVGGFVLGMGFIIAGYCPGTSVVAAASGNVDGLFTVLGVMAGALLYGEIQPFIQAFHDSSNLGPFFLWQWLKLPPAVVALLVVAMAVGCFVGAEKVERIFTAKRGESPVAPAPRPRRAAFGGFAVAAAAGLALMAVSGSRKAEAGVRAPVAVTAAELAQRVVAEPWKLRLVDLRAAESCAKTRIPGSECVPPASLPALGLAYDPSGRDLVLVTESGTSEVPAAAAAWPGRVLALQGGFASWASYALAAPQPPDAAATEEQRAEYRMRSAIHSMMTGVKQAPPPPAPTGGAVAPKKKGGGGCGG